MWAFWSITTLLAFWALYKNFLEGPKIRIYAGDRINIVKSVDCKAKKIQVACTFTNAPKKAGIVNKVAIFLKGKNTHQTHLFEWLIFYDYFQGPHTRPSSGVCPISVPGNDTKQQGIEFVTKDEINWQEGKYDLEVFARIRGNTFLTKKKINDKFSIVLSKQYIHDLVKKETLDEPNLRTVIIEGRELK